MELDVSPNGMNTHLRINHPTGNFTNFTEVASAGTYRISSSSLQFQFPIDKIRTYLVDAASMSLIVTAVPGATATTRSVSVSFGP